MKAQFSFLFFLVSIACFVSIARADEKLANRSIGFPKDFHPEIEGYKAEHGGRAPPKGVRDLIIQQEVLYTHAMPWLDSPEARGMKGLPPIAPQTGKRTSRKSSTSAQKPITPRKSHPAMLKRVPK